MSRIGDRHRREHGFTLVELVVALAIMGLVLAFVIPMMSGPPSRAELRATARTVAAGLRDTRNRAMMRGHAEAFLVDTAHGAFRAGAVGRTHYLPRGVAISLVTASRDRVNDQVGGIEFFADGSSVGGGVRLTGGNVGDLVLIDWLTGNIAVEDVARDATP